MITISLCMIVKNEEKVLGRCLNSVRDLVDEIIIIDTGSNDSTKYIASGFTPHVFDYIWNYDFSEARNFSFSKATKDYILWLDADDVLLEEDMKKFLELKGSLDPSADVVVMNYNVWVNENDKAVTSIKRERLVKRNRNFKWIEPVHEILNFQGNILHSDICITHKPEHESSSRNAQIYEKILANGKSLSPKGIFNYAEELFSNQKFDEAMEYFNRTLTISGQSFSYYVTACQRLSACYRIKNDTANSIRELLRSFEYDTPHPYICCQLGEIFKSLQDYKKAIFWYELALSIGKRDTDSGILANHFLGYVPCIELSSCYQMLGDKEKASYYKDKTSEFRQEKVIIDVTLIS